MTTLLNPDDEAEWTFLRSCAFKEFDEGWVDAGAIQSLRLSGSHRSEQILLEAQVKNPDRAESIARAIKYIESNAAPLRDRDLEVLGKRVAGARYRRMGGQ